MEAGAFRVGWGAASVRREVYRNQLDGSHQRLGACLGSASPGCYLPVRDFMKMNPFQVTKDQSKRYLTNST